MTDLAQILERFNRKERHLLVRDILGHTSDKGIPLSKKFLNCIDTTLKLKVPAQAWWATDYHLDWLAGALTLYTLGDQANLQATYSNPRDTKTGRKLVGGTQEDSDLVIAYDQHLIIIEAKAYGSWSNRQASSKIQRWENLIQHCKLLGNTSISFHFALMSPEAPKRLLPLPTYWSGTQSIIPHIELDLHTMLPIYEVVRCDAAGKRLKTGEYWRLVERSAKASPA